jgi:hypothetical protein
MTLTRAQTRAFGYVAGIRLGAQRTATSIAADGLSLYDPEEYTGAPAGDYTGGGIYRPGVAAVDQFRRIATLSAGSAYHAGAAWADLTTLGYELLGLGLEPSEINDVIQQCLRILYVNYYHPIGWHEDNDFSGASTTSPYDWDTPKVNMTSVAKTSTGGVWTRAGQTGPKNLVLTGNATGNGYVPSSARWCNAGEDLFHGAIGRVNTAGATGSYVLYDTTNSQALETVTFTARDFIRIAKTTRIETAGLVVARIGNVTASAATEWDCLFGHKLGMVDSTILLPSWLKDRWQFYGFGPALYEASQVSTDIWPASARRITSWDPGQDGYEPLPLEENASVSELQINKRGGLTANDFWVYGRRQRSDFETLDNETDTTNAGDDEMREAFFYLLFDLLWRKHQNRIGDNWGQMADEWERKVMARRRAKPPIQPTTKKQDLYVGL